MQSGEARVDALPHLSACYNNITALLVVRYIGTSEKLHIHMYICIYLHADIYSYIYMYILGWKYHIHRTHTYIHHKTRTVVWRFDMCH